jgi:hypothetical protein
MVSMTIPETRLEDVPTDGARVEEALRLLSGVPVGLDVAVKRLSRGGGVYAWWAGPLIFPDLPGPPNESLPSLRLLYLGRATSLRGRILRNHLRRSGNSTLRRTLAGLLVSEGYRTTWTDRVVLVSEDEARLTAWMYAHLRLTWAQDAEPATIEDELCPACAPAAQRTRRRPRAHPGGRGRRQELIQHQQPPGRALANAVTACPVRVRVPMRAHAAMRAAEVGAG